MTRTADLPVAGTPSPEGPRLTAEEPKPNPKPKDGNRSPLPARSGETRQPPEADRVLGLPESVFHSGVFFIGGCQFKTPMSPNVLNNGLRSWIEARRIPILAPDQVTRIVETLTKHERNTDRRAVARQHIKDLKQRR